MQPMDRPLGIGLFAPQFEGWLGGETAGWLELLAFARSAEDIGIDAIWLADHLLFQIRQHAAVQQRRACSVTEEPARGIWECWSLLAGLAATTSRISLGTLVTATSFRNPALLAKMADTVDEISGGRLLLGLGSGAHANDHHAFGFPFTRQIDRFEEALQIIVPLLRHGAVDFQGHYYVARECELHPRSPSAASPPILIGSKGPRMLGLTVRYADVWNTPWCNTLEQAIALRAVVDDACRAAGRDPATLGRTVSIMVDLPVGDRSLQPAWVAAYRESLDPITLPSAELAKLLLAYAGEGIEHIQIWLEPCTIEGIEAFAPVLSMLN